MDSRPLCFSILWLASLQRHHSALQMGRQDGAHIDIASAFQAYGQYLTEEIDEPIRFDIMCHAALALRLRRYVYHKPHQHKRTTPGLSQICS
ncbi:hypothetical protein BDZ91DRAFT_724726 [Kalaharituber pfeilii]|nr:hypothetical protein BDZ91DRAFT_724726 [Kalaharituber pfeilii]